MNQSAGTLADKLQTLSPEDIAAVEEFVDLLRARKLDRALTRAAEQTSAPAFDAVWNNPEDDVYDALRFRRSCSGAISIYQPIRIQAAPRGDREQPVL